MTWNGVYELVWRLCQVDEEDGGLPGAGRSPGEPGYDPSTTHIAYGSFCDALMDVLGGYHTITQMKTFYNMPTEQQQQLDALVARINSALTLESKVGRIGRLRSILSKWQIAEDLNLAGYDTPADIQTHLLNIDSGFL